MTTAILSQLQLALFFKDFEPRPDKLIEPINSVLGNPFDAIPTILPLPPEAPPQIAVVRLTSTSQPFTCNIAKSRIDFFMSAGDSSRSPDEYLSEFDSRISSLLGYLDSTRKLVRVGYIAQYFSPCLNSVDSLEKKYLKVSMSDAEELSVRFNKRQTIGSLVCNDIIEITANAKTNIKGKEEVGLFVQRDYNNVPLERALIRYEMDQIVKEARSLFVLAGINEVLP